MGYLKLIFVILLLSAFYSLGIIVIAQLFRIRLEEITIGVGRQFFSIYTRNTKVNFALFPIGGYYRLADYSPNSGSTKSSWELRTKPFLVQIILVISGVFSLLALSVVLLGPQEFLSILSRSVVGYAKVFILQSESIFLGEGPDWLYISGFIAIQFAILHMIPFANLTGDRLIKLFIYQYAEDLELAYNRYAFIKKILFGFIICILALNFII